MKLLIPNLQPGTAYAIQVRSDDGAAQSEWSPALRLTTTTDTVLPKTPAGFSWTVTGDAFLAAWNQVTQNVNNDMSLITRYEIELTANGVTKVVAVPQNASVSNYTLSFETNRALFTTPQATVAVRIRSVDNKGLTSSWSSVESATNPVPAVPTAVTAAANINQIVLSWTPPADNDIIGYNVYTSGDVKLAFINATSYTHRSTTYSSQTLKVAAVDKFNQESTRVSSNAVTPTSPFTADTTAPATPTSFAGSITNAADNRSATANLTWAQTVPSPDDLIGFEIRYREVGATPYNSGGTFDKDARAAGIVLSKANTNHEFQIRSVDTSFNYSAWTSTLTVTSAANSAPGTVTGLTASAGRDSISYNWTALTDPDIRNYELQISSVSTFASLIATFNNGTSTSLAVNGLNPSTTYYARVRATDTGGLTSASWSTTNTASTTAFPTTPLSDGVAPTTSPTPTIVPGIGHLFVQWPAITNNDAVTYEVHVSATNNFTTSATTRAAQTSATQVILETLANGTALAYGTMYYVKIIAKDVDGPGPVGTQASGSPRKAVVGDVEITAPEIGGATPGDIAAEPKVYVQSFQPTIKRDKDLWIDTTNDGYIPKRWNGTVYVIASDITAVEARRYALAPSVITNPTRTGTLEGWSGPIGSNTEPVDFNGTTVQSIKSTLTTGSGVIYSNWFEVDPTKAYEIRFWALDTAQVPSGVQFYTGLHGNDTPTGTGNNVGFTGLNRLTGAVGATNANFYFSTTASSQPVWTEHIYYIVPVGTPGSEVIGLGTALPGSNGAIARALPNLARTRVRILNYNNDSSVPRDVYIVNPTVTTVSMESLRLARQRLSDYNNDVINPIIGKVNTSVKSYATEYAVNSSESTAPTSGWSTSTPARTPGTFVWYRVTVTYNDLTTNTTNPVLLTGNTGAPGSNAPVVSLTATTQVLTSPAAGGATTPTASTIIGIAANTTISVYEYSVNGAAFSSTVPAGVSRSGNTVTITGSTMTARTITVRMADAGGIADTMTVAKVADGAQGNPGNDGSDGYTVLLTNEANVFAGSTTAAVAGSTSTQVIAYKGSTLQSATIGTITGQVTGLTTSIANNNTTTPVVTISVTTSLTAQSGTLTIPITVDGRTFNKTFSWSVSRTGQAGNDGRGIASATITYQVGTSASTVPTGTWTSTIPATSPGQFLWTRTVTAYTSGSDTTAYSVAAHGSTGNAGNDGRGVSGTTVTYQVGTSATTAPTGTWTSTVPATSPGQFLWTRTITTYTDNLNPTTAYSVSAHGAQGDPGVSVVSLTPYYQQVATGASAPAKPTASTPPAPWTAVEPGYTANTELYRTERIGFSDSTFAYTNVVKVSSYTAATQAITSANGKNSIFWKQVVPTTSDAGTIGDTWYVRTSADSFQIRGVYELTAISGSTYTWTSRIIRGEVIDNLDASSITTGLLNAARVRIGTTTTYENGYDPTTKETPAGAQARATAALNTALLNDSVSNSSGPGPGKTFHNPLNWSSSQNGAATGTGYIVIKTPITFVGFMTTIQIQGYNYNATAASGVEIDSIVSFYAYDTTNKTFTNTGQTSSGSLSIGVRLAEQDGKVVLILENNLGIWYYPKIIIPEAIIGHSTPPDAFKDGWSAAIETDLSPYTIKNSPVRRDMGESHITLNSWRTPTNTTEINGGKITTDTVEAVAIKAGTAFTQNLFVKSVFTLGDASTAGIIRSFNYVAGNSGFTLASNGLEINEGIVRARALDVRVGGGNMWDNSSFDRNNDGAGTGYNTGWTLYNNGQATIPATLSRVAPGRLGTGAAARITIGAASTHIIGFYRPAPGGFKTGTRYTVSYYVRGSGGMVGRPLTYAANNPQPTDVRWHFTLNPDTLPVLTGSWQRVAFSFSRTDTTDNIFFGVAAPSAAGWVEFDDVQLEEGEIPTSYTPMTSEILPGTISGDMLIADTTVTSILRINTGGSIRSANYSGTTGYLINESGIYIREGTVAANTLATGNITTATLTLGSGGILKTNNSNVQITDQGIFVTGGSQITASSLTTGTFASGQALTVNGNMLLNGNLQVQTGGYIKSTDYTGTTQASNPSGVGWYLGRDGLHIDTGIIAADAVRAGSLGGPSGTNSLIDLTAGTALRINGGHIRSNTYATSGGSQIGTYAGGTAAVAGFYLGSDGLRIVDGAVSASALTAGTITGTNEIQLSGANAKITGTGFSLSGTGLTVTSGSIAAASLVITSAFAQNVQNNVTTIDGGKITTGTIQSTKTVTIDGSTEPLWSIVTNPGVGSEYSAATFTHLRVRGDAVVGKSATDEASAVRSSNYTQSATEPKGWALNGNGTADFLGLTTPTIRVSALASIGSDGMTAPIVLANSGSLIARNETTGAQVGISGTEGFFVRGPIPTGQEKGPDYVSFPINPTTDGSMAPNIISGVLNATTLSVRGNTETLEAATFFNKNYLEMGASLTLRNKIATAVAPPTVTLGHVYVKMPVVSGWTLSSTAGFPTASGTANMYATYSAANSHRLYTIASNAGTVTSFVTLTGLPSSGTSQSLGTVTISGFTPKSVEIIGSEFYILGTERISTSQTNGFQMAIYVFNASGAFQRRAVVSPFAGSPNVANFVSMGVSSTNVYIADRAGNGNLQFTTYSTALAAGAVVSTGTSMLNIVFKGFSVGNADFGAFRYSIPLTVSTGVNVYSYNSSGTQIPAETFKAGKYNIDSIDWDAARGHFVGFSLSTIQEVFGPGSIKYTGIVGVEGAKLSVGTTKYDSANNYESIVSTLASVSMQNRSSVIVTADSGSSTNQRVYFSTASGTPTNAQLFRQTELLGAVISARTYSTLVLTGSNPPATGTFPENLASAGTLKSEVFDTFDSSGTRTSGSATITGGTGFRQSMVGSNVTGTGIPLDTIILTVNSATSITLSKAATASGTSTVSVLRPRVDLRGSGFARVKELYSDEARFSSLVPANYASGNKSALVVGDGSGPHLRVSDDIILAMDGPSTAGTLYLQPGAAKVGGSGGTPGGLVLVGSPLQVNGGDLDVNHPNGGLIITSGTNIQGKIRGRGDGQGALTILGASVGVTLATMNGTSFGSGNTVPFHASTATVYAGFFDAGITGSSVTGASISAAGRIIRTSSSRKYKSNIRPLGIVQAKRALQLEAVSFNMKEEAGMESRARYPGFIAEQAHEIGMEYWVNYDTQGQPDGFRYSELTAAHNILLKDLYAKVDALGAESAAAKKNNESLAAQVTTLEAQVATLMAWMESQQIPTEEVGPTP